MGTSGSARRLRRFWWRLGAAIGALLVVATGVALPAAGSGPAPYRPPLPDRPPATVLDGFDFAHLPPGLGGSTDFAYHFQGVDFAGRVWESQSDDGGWRVDLDIDVMRGHRLTDGRALHDWFIRYEDRDPPVPYLRTEVRGHPAWLARDQVFWLQQPGLAVSVQLDGSRWSTWEVMRTGWSATLVPS